MYIDGEKTYRQTNRLKFLLKTATTTYNLFRAVNSMKVKCTFYAI